jgi:ketosteroid isomerase-like protein
MLRSISVGRGVAIAIVLCLGMMMSSGERATAQESGATAAQAKAAVIRWLTAVSSGDAGQVGAVLAPEFQLQRADGSGYTKEEYLATGLPYIPSVPAVSNLIATVHGDLMVVRYTLDLPPETVIGGGPVSPTAPRLSVFRRDGDNWQISAHANFAEPRQ